MKKANMTLGFKDNYAVTFDQSIHLLQTKSGYYTMPINPYKTIVNNVNVKSKSKCNLSSNRK